MSVCPLEEVDFSLFLNIPLLALLLQITACKSRSYSSRIVAESFITLFIIPLKSFNGFLKIYVHCHKTWAFRNRSKQLLKGFGFQPTLKSTCFKHTYNLFQVFVYRYKEGNSRKYPCMSSIVFFLVMNTILEIRRSSWEWILHERTA